MRHLETFEKVTVDYDHTAKALYITDYDSGEQLAIFYVLEED